MNLIDLVSQYVEKGDFTLSSGIKSPFYIDCRKLTLSSEGLLCVVNLFWEKIIRYEVNSIGGPTIGADPIIGGLLYHASQQDYPLRGFLFRKESKLHGKENKIAGSLHKNDKILIIDDVITTGKSVLDLIDYIKDYNCDIKCISCIVDRGFKTSLNFEPLLKIDNISF